MLGLSHRYKIFIKALITIKSGSFALLSTIYWGVANEATPHYPTVELRMFMEFRDYASSNTA